MNGMEEFDKEFAEHLYCTPDEFAKKAGIWPLRAGRNEAKPNYRSGPKFIECYSLHFVLDGQAVLFYGDRQALLGPGDLFCLFPYRLYRYRIAPSAARLAMNWVAFDGRQAPDLLRLAGIEEEQPYARGAADARVKSVLRHILREFRGVQGQGHSLPLIAGLYRLFGLLAAPAPAQTPRPATDEWLARSLEFIDAHLFEGITVEDAARFAGVHRSYFADVFSRHVGMPPSRYMRRLKLEKGARLLKESGFTVTDVALSVGYPDLYSFTRAFQKHWGVSPSAYRKDNALIKK